MKIDLHVHTSERSPCGNAPTVTQIRAAIAAGLDAIVLTDHKKLAPVKDIREWNNQFTPFRIFNGIELCVEDEDFLVLGIHDKILENQDWSFAELHAFVRSRGGGLILAHPFRYKSHIAVDLKKYPIDAMEIYSCNTPPSAAEDIFTLAEELNIPVVCNSDAHSIEQLGTYHNELLKTPRDEQELVAILQEKQFIGMANLPEETIKYNIP